jgi:acetyl esterase/lipase
MIHISEIIIAVLTAIVALMSSFLLFMLPRPTTPLWWAVKALPTVLSPFLFIASLVFFAAGLIFPSTVITLLAAYCIMIYGTHIFRVTRGPDAVTGFDQAFGDGWAKRISGDQKRSFLRHRLLPLLPRVPEPILRQDVVYHVLPDGDRRLLCDIWEPARGVVRSGLAFIYVHGSAWIGLDKDVGTRTFFKHLAAQGHVIMDIAYRLYPETDITGMVYDVRRAVAWMKANASRYQVDPARVVLGGGSAGGHLSLLTAYTENNDQLRPADLTDVDTRVMGVISLYGPTDLEALYYHTGQNAVYAAKRADPNHTPPDLPVWLKRSMGANYHRLGFDKGNIILPDMFGGEPEELADQYELLSPVTHIHSKCPATLLILGEHDIITSPDATKEFCLRLEQAGVPVVLHLLPQTDHGFDLFMPLTNPAAHNAYYDIERFLGIMSTAPATRYREQVLAEIR